MALMVSSSTGLAGSVYTSAIPASLDMVPVYMKKKLLQIIDRKLVFDMLADKEDLPPGNGKVVRFLRYEKLGLPLTPLTEGVTPTVLRELVVNAVEAQVDQWGDVGGVSDVADLTLFHKALQILIERMADQAAETVDREDQRALIASTTNLVFPNTATIDRTGVAATDFINTDVLRRVIADMRDRGVPDFGGDYIGVCDPFVEQDITKDQTYITAATQQNLPPLFGGKINPPRWMGVRWMISNHIPVIARDTAVTPTAGSAFAAVAKDSTETALAAVATHVVQITGLNPSGFETHLGLVSAPITIVGAQVIQGTLNAATGNIVAYNVYWSQTGAAGTVKLIGQGIAPGSVVRISGNGTTSTAGAIGLAATNTGAVAPPVPAAGVNIHQTYILGKEAFGSVKLTNIETMLTPNVPSDSDPMKQRRKAAWKVLFKCVVKNSNFYRRIESDSFYGSNATSFGILS